MNILSKQIFLTKVHINNHWQYPLTCLQYSKNFKYYRQRNKFKAIHCVTCNHENWHRRSEGEPQWFRFHENSVQPLDLFWRKERNTKQSGPLVGTESKEETFDILKFALRVLNSFWEKMWWIFNKNYMKRSASKYLKYIKSY